MVKGKEKLEKATPLLHKVSLTMCGKRRQYSAGYARAKSLESKATTKLTTGGTVAAG